MDETPIPVQYILYTNHAVAVAFADGSQLKLAPCGSAFIHQQPPTAGQHPLQSDVLIQQRTQFVTSSYRQKVRLAVDFRNRFVEHPFLCQGLLDPCDVLRYRQDISVVSWLQSFSKCHFTVFPNGSVQVSSLDGYANVCLASHQKAFTVRFLAKLSSANPTQVKTNGKKFQTDSTLDSLPQSSHNSVGDGRKASVSKDSRVSHTRLADASKQSALPAEGKTITVLNTTSWDYCWTVQHHSIRNFPAYWKHPLSLLQKFIKSPNYLLAVDKAARQLTEVVEKMAAQADDVASEADVVRIALPRTLGLRCPGLHLHKLKTDSSKNSEGIYSGKAKAFYMKGTVYRLFCEERKCIEIYPEDGSIICSSGQTGQTLNHFIFSGGQVEERVYSIQYPPPVSVDFSYSISKLISTAARCLETLSDENIQLNTRIDPICYEFSKTLEALEVPSLPSVIEECVVPGVGRFTAESNGVLRVVFTDRTCLDMQVELSAHLRAPKEKNSMCGMKSRQLFDWPVGSCRILLRNGHYHFTSLDHPEAPYANYVQAALSWALWVNTPKNERHAFYKDTIHDSNCWRTVDLELKKIERVSYVVENYVMPKAKGVLKAQGDTLSDKRPKSSQSDSLPENYDAFDNAAISEMLKKNSDALKDIDQFLKMNCEAKPSKDVNM